MYDCANIGSPFIVFAGGFGGIAYALSHPGRFRAPLQIVISLLI